MRCFICDFGPGVPSMYHSGLSIEYHTDNKVVWDNDLNNYICTDCQDQGEWVEDEELLDEDFDT